MMSKQALPRHLSESSEIPLLIHWSPPWIRVSALLIVLLFLELTAVSLKLFFEGGNPFAAIAKSVEASSYLAVLILTISILKKSQNYIQTENDSFLGEMMACVVALWESFSVAVVTTSIGAILSFFSFLVKGTLPSLGGAVVGSLALSGFVLPLSLTFLFFRLERRAPYAGASFTRTLQLFGARSLVRLRILSILCFVGGVFCVLLWFFLTLGVVHHSFSSCLITGFFLAVIGGMAQWYRRSVRDIERNPTIIFYERTLNRLNVFWLVLPFALGGIFLSELLMMF